MSLNAHRQLSMRVYLALPVGVLVASLAMMIVIVQVRLSGGAPGHEVLTVERGAETVPRKPFIEAAKALKEHEDLEAQHTEAIFALLSQGETLLDLITNASAGGAHATTNG